MGLPSVLHILLVTELLHLWCWFSPQIFITALFLTTIFPFCLQFANAITATPCITSGIDKTIIFVLLNSLIQPVVLFLKLKWFHWSDIWYRMIFLDSSFILTTLNIYHHQNNCQLMFYHKVQNDVMQVLCLLIITQIRKAAWRILSCQPTNTELRRNLTRWKCHHYKGLPKEGVGG